MGKYLRAFRTYTYRLTAYAFRVLPFAILATILASIFSTQFVVNDLGNAGAPVNFADRISMTAHDVVNLGPNYGAFILIALMIAFRAARFVFEKMRAQRQLIYIAAGMVGFIVMLHLMKAVFFGVPIIAGARSGLGLAFQALAGGVAGFMFAKLTTPKQDKTS